MPLPLPARMWTLERQDERWRLSVRIGDRRWQLRLRQGPGMGRQIRVLQQVADGASTREKPRSTRSPPTMAITEARAPGSPADGEARRLAGAPRDTTAALGRAPFRSHSRREGDNRQHGD